MRKAIYILVALCSLAPLFLQAQEPNYNELWNRANNHYSLGEYQDALSAYKQIEEAGMVSYKLYYNIANTYYKLKEDGHALLYYERALKLNPSDKDIKNNLEIAKLKTLDKIEVIPDFILTVWIGKLKNSLSCFHLKFCICFVVKLKSIRFIVNMHFYSFCHYICNHFFTFLINKKKGGDGSLLPHKAKLES